MNGDLISQGVELMLVGMGTVFLFLTLLVVATWAMSRMILAWLPEPTGDEAEADLIAAVTAAVQHHRRRQ